MKGVIYTSLQLCIFYLFLTDCITVCPPDGYLKPCECYNNSAEGTRIVCKGNINQDDLKIISKNLSNYTFDYLHVYNSSLVTIDAGIFDYFKNVYIENNDKLIGLTGSSEKSPGLNLTVLSIRFNKSFKGTGIFNIIQAYKDCLEILELHNNSIDVLDGNLDSFSKLKIIRLDNQINGIEEIPRFFLGNLTKLSQLRLNNNKIKSIGFHAIGLTSNQGDGKISIYLNDNSIKSDQLDHMAIKISANSKTIIELDIENNTENLDLEYSAKLFSSIVKIGGHVFLKSNNACDCEKLKDIEDKLDKNIATNVFGLKCKLKTDDKSYDKQYKDCNIK